MQDRIELDLSEIIKIMYKKKVVILGTTIVVAILASIINLFVLDPVYQSKVSIIVGQEDLEKDNPYAYSSDTVVLSQKLIQTYSEIATSDKVLKKTVDDLSLNYDDDEYELFKKRVLVTSKENTQVLEISVKDEDPVKATNIANKLTQNFIKEAGKYLPLGELKLLDKASIPKDSVEPNKAANVLIATAITFIGISTLILLKDLKGMKIVDEKDVETYLNLKVLGTIREMNSK